MSNVYNNFDYVRIGPDVSLTFDAVPVMKMLHREIPSTKNAIQNTFYRSFMDDRWFGNDPDVFLLRDTNIKLKKDQKKALAIINALFGRVFFTSDNVGEYDEEKKELLNHALNLFKNATDVSFVTIGKIVHVTYLLDKKPYEFDYDVEKGVIKNER